MSKNEYTVRVLRKFVIDAFLLFALTLAIYATELLWIPFQRGFFCGDESLMYPYNSDTVTSDMLKLYGIGIPALFFIICEWFYLRNEREDQTCFGIRIPVWIQGVYCAFVSFATGLCFSELTANISKNIIGRPRPHFLDVCRPSIDCSLPEWRGRYIQSHEFQCTGDRSHLFVDMHRSFLSGHSTWSSYCMVFLALYLEKRMFWSGTRVFRHTVQFCILMMSWFTALSRISDYKHHWSDVLAGYLTGISIAIITFNWCTDLIERRKQCIQNQQDVAHVLTQITALPK